MWKYTFNHSLTLKQKVRQFSPYNLHIKFIDVCIDELKVDMNFVCEIKTVEIRKRRRWRRWRKKKEGWDREENNEPRQKDSYPRKDCLTTIAATATCVSSNRNWWMKSLFVVDLPIWCIPLNYFLKLDFSLYYLLSDTWNGLHIYSGFIKYPKICIK